MVCGPVFKFIGGLCGGGEPVRFRDVGDALDIYADLCCAALHVGVLQDSSMISPTCSPSAMMM